MNTSRILLMAVIVLLGEAECFSQPIVWNGNGDGASWSNPQNWVGQQAPGPANNVFITNGAGSNVVISTAVAVESILCGKALTISSGSLAVTEGLSSLQGALTLSSGAILAASGSSTTLTSGGSVSADGANFNVSAGAVMTLPALQNYTGGCDIFTWTVAGPNSVLNLPGLTNMTQASCGSGGHIQADAGGQILAANLASIAQAGDPQTVQADGTNSLINFSGLETVSGPYIVTFEASGGGTNWVPSLIGGTNAYVALYPGGTLPVAQVQQLGGITASNVTVDFTSLSSFDGGNISLSGGAVVTLLALQDYSGACGRFTWTVVGPGSVLDLPVLTNMTQPYCGHGGQIQAEAGGQILAANLASLSEEGEPETVQADGTNSLVNFSGLGTVSGAYTITFEASGGGTNWVPGLIGGTNAYLALNPGGTLPVARVQQLGGIMAADVTNNFPSLTNFDGGNISLSGGAVVTLPGLQNYSGGCGSFIWTVVGHNSVLNLPGLTNMTGPFCGRGGQIQAEAGGQILATNLASFDQEGDPETVQVDGTNSLVDFSNLRTDSGAFAVTFEASSGGTNWVPHFIGGTNVYVALNAGGTLPVAQMQQLAGIADSNVTANFTSLSNFDGGSISVSGGAAVTLPAIESYSTPYNSATWQIANSGSVLNLPALTNLLGSYCCPFNIEALAGGQVLLDNLTSVQDGNVSLLSDGTGSVINLTQLSRFVISTGQGQITAQNNGTILFNNQAFLLANTAINIPAGNPILPPTLIASPTLTLCGTAWDSYRVEERNTLVPGSPMTVLLVPLTNIFQAIAAVPPPNTTFLVTEFVANPPILQMSLTPDSQVQLVLYGLTTATYQIQSATNLLAPITWTPGSVAAMTNAFRIFPETPPAAVRQFYRAEQE